MNVTTKLSPWLTVKSDGDAIEFYERAFGAVVQYRVPGGGVAHLAIDGAEFWISDASPERDRVTPADLPGHTHWLLLIVDDPDALVARAVRAGARPGDDIGDSHDWRSGTVFDRDGHEWTIGKPLVAWPPNATA